MRTKVSIGAALLGLGTAAIAATLAMSEPSSPSQSGTVEVVPGSSGSDTSSPFANQAVMLAAAAWRSVLYPSNWLPVGEGGQPTSDGKFLHDFSYAGYLAGNVPIPTTVGANVTRSLAASTWGNGSADATTGIQAAIDQVCAGGGGTVLLGAGTYRIKPQGSANFAINLKCRDLILRGAKDSAGKPASFIFNDEPNMRQKRVIVMGDAGSGVWASLYDTTGNTANDKVTITQDLLLPTRTIPVSSVANYQVDDYVAITADWSDAFKAEHGMSPFWPADQARGFLFYRRIQAVDPVQKTLKIDIPIRYALKVRDRARVYKPRQFLANIGIENIAIGMRENNVPGVGDDDFKVAGTGAYEMTQATAIQVVLLRHGWIRNVVTYRPPSNTRDVHVLSNMLHLTASTRSITVVNCNFQKAQYRGEGGNGGMFSMNGSELLIRDNVADGGRHNFVTSSPVATGNVLLNNVSSNGRYEDDYHQFLSPSNLVDGHIINSKPFSTYNRRYDSDSAGITSSQSVFWNSKIKSTYTGTAIRSEQFGWGYVIGTSGISNGVVAPDDHVEGVGIGDGLVPASLYLDQKAKRDANPNY